VRSTGTSDYGKLTNAGSSSTLALDPDTGKIKWEIQSTPAETWDYDGVNELVLADVSIDGQSTPIYMKADRDGFFFVANRDTGKLVSAEPFVPVNWAKGFDVETDRPIEDPAKRPRLTERQVTWLEETIDSFNVELSPLDSFVLSGGSAPSACLHYARTLLRRAERYMTEIAYQEPVNPTALRYANRLSDLLFVLARYLNDKGRNDTLWKPGRHR
jgi:hypothetical protein